MIGLYRHRSSFGRSENLLTADDHLPNRGARKAQEQDLLSRMKALEPVLSLEQRYRSLPRARPAENKEMSVLGEDSLTLLHKSSFIQTDSLGAEGTPASGSGFAARASWIETRIIRIVSGSSEAVLTLPDQDCRIPMSFPLSSLQYIDCQRSDGRLNRGRIVKTYVVRVVGVSLHLDEETLDYIKRELFYQQVLDAFFRRLPMLCEAGKLRRRVRGKRYFWLVEKPNASLPRAVKMGP